MADVTNNFERVMKEVIIPNLNTTFESEQSLVNFFEKRKSVPMSKRATRIELKVSPGGEFAAVNQDAGSYPGGVSGQIVEATLNTVGCATSMRLSRLSQKATQGQKAIVDILSEHTAEIVSEHKRTLDCLLQGTNDGVLGIIQTVGSAPTYNLDHASNPFGAYLLREGQKYDIYASDMTTLRSGGPYQINKDGGIDFEAQNVTFSASITSGAQNDRIVAQGMVNAGYFGIAYHVSDSSSGTWQGISRAKPYTQVRSVDAASGMLQHSHLRLSLNKVRFRNGEDVLPKLTPYCGPAQKHAYEDLLNEIAIWDKSKTRDNADLMYADVVVQGKPLMVNAHADPTKFQWLDKQAFIRAETIPFGFFQDKEGKTIFPIVSTSTGVPTAEDWFAVEQCFQVGCVDPTNMAYVKSLAVPAGYIS